MSKLISKVKAFRGIISWLSHFNFGLFHSAAQGSSRANRESSEATKFRMKCRNHVTSIRIYTLMSL